MIRNAELPTDRSKQKAASKKLVRGSALMLFGRLLSIVINFAVQILMVRFLIKSDYGAFAYAMSFVTIGSSLAVFGLGKTITRFVPIFQERKDYPRMTGTIVLALVSVAGLGVFIVTAIHGFRGFIAPYLASDPRSIGLLLVMIVLCPIQAIENIFEGMFAIFASPRALFARRFLVGPFLKLAAVLPIVFFHNSVWVLAWSYVIAGVLGSMYSCGVLYRVIRDAGLMEHFRPSSWQLPVKEIFTFSAPMALSDLLPTVRVAMVSILLEFFRGTLGVASFRAVLPLARLNHAPRDSFRLLFTPTLARMFARGDREGVEHAYWQSTIWIAVLTFPLFIVSIALPKQIILLLFGSEYSDSANLFSILLGGYYVSAVLGFSTYTLRIYGHIRRIFLNDISTAVSTIVFAVVVIPRFGMVGAACVTASSLLLNALLNNLAVVQYGIIRSMDRSVVRSLVAIVVSTGIVVVLRLVTEPSVPFAIAAASLATMVVVWASLSVLDVASTFPELAKYLPFRRQVPMQPMAGKS